jgi:hypothetical protein
MTAGVRFTGWHPGMKKVALDRLLHERAGLSLYDAHRQVTRVLAGETVTVPMADAAAAAALARDAAELGAVADVVILTA